MKEQWSKEQAWEWYNAQPWLRGCNYLPSDCCNWIALWQELDFDCHLVTADRELALAASIGFNSIRVLLGRIVWEQEHDGFLDRFERFLQVAAGHGISLMVCFANDCTVPHDQNYRPPQLGEQPCDWGYHGGRKHSPHTGQTRFPGYNPDIDEPETAERLYGMVREIIGLYANDPRIVVWDLFNEPGNSNRGELSVPAVRRIFEEARSCNPMQPLTSGIWNQPDALTPAEKNALILSDVISYHNYGDYKQNILEIHALRRYGRPLLNTEWLNRMCGNTIDEMFPLFFLEKIGCWNWGLVAGLFQGYEPHEAMWQAMERGETKFDFTRWMHDLFRPSLRPYDPKEIEIIKSFCKIAERV